MGFALFDQSGTFNPSDHGLSPGDTIYALAVGGGGGGAAAYICTNSYAVAPGLTGYAGGKGGTSSFGSYLSALGGSGGVTTSSLSSLRNLQGKQGGALGGLGATCNSFPIAAGGAGGWLPGGPQEPCAGQNALVIETSASWDFIYQIGAPKGTGSPGSVYIYSSSSYAKPALFEPSSMWQYELLKHTFTASDVSLSAVPVAYGKVRAGTAMIEGNTHDIRCGRGGRGYGAGGGSVSENVNSAGRNSTGTHDYACGGNAGEIKSSIIQLTSIDPIAVTVGGGGGGAAAAYTYSRSTAYARYTATGYGAGNNGAAGSGGAARALVVSYYTANSTDASSQYTQNSGAGGYGGSTAEKTDALLVSDGKYCACGGGGAGGCVAIWW